MIERTIGDRKLIVAPEDGWIHELPSGEIIIEVPVQLHEEAGIRVGSVWLGTDKVEGAVSEAMLWAKRVTGGAL